MKSLLGLILMIGMSWSCSLILTPLADRDAQGSDGDGDGDGDGDSDSDSDADPDNDSDLDAPVEVFDTSSDQDSANDAHEDADEEDSGPHIDSDIRELWWSAEYRRRRPIVVKAGGSPVPNGASLFFTADTNALIGSDEVRDDGRDWRIVRHNAARFDELHRWIDDGEGGGWSSGDTRTWFKMASDVSESTTDAMTYLYYDHPGEDSEPPADMLQVFLFGDDFEGDTWLWSAVGRGETYSKQSTIVGAGLKALKLSPGETYLAGLHRDQLLPHTPLVFSQYIRYQSKGSSFGNLRLFELDYSDRDPDWLEDGTRVHVELNEDASMFFIRHSPWTRTTLAGELAAHTWHRVEVIYDPVSSEHAGRVNDNAFTAFVPDFNGSGAAIRSMALEGEGQGGDFYLDNYIVRLHIEDEPEVTLGDVEVAW